MAGLPPAGRSLIAAAVASLATVLGASPAGAAIAPGDVLVGEINPATGDGAVIKVDPVTGEQTLISSNAIPVNLGSSEFLDDPYGITVSPSGAILVADEVGKSEGGSTGSLIAIDAATGKQTLVAANSLSGPDLFQDPIDVAFAPGLGLVVADYNAFTGGYGGLVKVVGNAQSTLSSNDQPVNLGTSELFENPNGVAVTHTGGLVVADGGSTRVISVNPATGKQSVLSSNTQPVNSSSMLLASPYGIDVEPSGRILVTDTNAFPGGAGGVIEIDPGTGKQSAVSSNDQPVNMGTSELFSGVRHLGRLLDGDLAVLNEDSPGYVIRVDRPTGKQSVLSSNDQPVNSGSMLFEDPYALTVVPPTCLGFFATISGSPGADLLRATPFPDVIAGMGGNDRIVGLGQGDYLCGDAGRDRLVGGAGADSLAGGAGRDRLLGGKGRDRLLGGGGPDRLRGGPARDILRGGPGRDRQRQ